MNIDIDYIIITLLTLYSFIVAGRRVAKNAIITEIAESNYDGYWRYVSFPVVMFSLSQGLRYMRGHDYYGYSRLFANFSEQRGETSAIYRPFMTLLGNIGFNQYSCFLAYAFIFIICAMFFLRDYKAYAKWLFPLFYMAYVVFNEYMIRQALGYSFFFLFMYYINQIEGLTKLLDNKYTLLKCSLCALICGLFHTANVLVISLYIVLYFFVRIPIKYWIAIPMYIACVYVLPSRFDFSLLNDLVSLMSDQNEMASHYAANVDKWFGAEGMDDRYTRNAIVQIFEVLGVSSMLYLGEKTIKQQHLSTNWIAFFNMAFIGVCISALFRNLELLVRIGHVISYLWCFVVAYILYHKSLNFRTKDAITYAGLLWFCYDFLKYVFMRTPGYTLFIWDAPSPINYIL